MSSSPGPDVEPRSVPSGAFLLDVREPHEWAAGYVPGATHLPLDALQERLAEIPGDTVVHCICRSGGRSSQAAAFLAAHGRRAVNVAGGMQAWAAAGKDMATDSGLPPRVI
jgi:rhodanese-related sulfurtransferase